MVITMAMDEMKSRIVQAIQLIKTEIRWKPNSAERHLYKRNGVRE